MDRWGLILQDVDLVIRYRSGKKNAGVDALFRLPIDQDDNGESSLSEKQDDNNDIFVAATVIVDNAKSGEREIVRKIMKMKVTVAAISRNKG